MASPIAAPIWKSPKARVARMLRDGQGDQRRRRAHHQRGARPLHDSCQEEPAVLVRHAAQADAERASGQDRSTRTRRWPKASPNRPAASSRLANVSTYVVTTHWISLTSIPNDSVIAGKAMFTMVSSDTKAPAAPTTATVAHPRRPTGESSTVTSHIHGSVPADAGRPPLHLPVERQPGPGQARPPRAALWQANPLYTNQSDASRHAVLRHGSREAPWKQHRHVRTPHARSSLVRPELHTTSTTYR